MQKVALAVVATICFAGCTPAIVPKSADVYFRPFQATSIVRLTENLMVTSAGSKSHITDKSRIARIMVLIHNPCQPSPRQPNDMDLRLLIYFNNASGRSIWKASQFDYYDGVTGKTCVMNPGLLTGLSTELGGA